MKRSKNILTDKEMELVSLLMQDCQSTGDIQSKLKRLFAGTIEQMLEAEMDEHLGYEKNSIEGNNSGNSRNGYNRKTIISDYGESEIAVPRDRNGEFEPKILEKRQTRTDEIEQKIMAMYAKGMSQRDIEDNLRQIYGAEIPQTLEGIGYQRYDNCFLQIDNLERAQELFNGFVERKLSRTFDALAHRIHPFLKRMEANRPSETPPMMTFFIVLTWFRRALPGAR